MNHILFEKYKTSEVTNTRRVICTPSAFTKNNFFYVQEAGYLKSLKPHLSKRSKLSSYLFMIVLSGSGTVTYRAITRQAKQGDCFYLDCMTEYTHISSKDDPWELMWIHFHGPQAKGYYSYFLEHKDWYFHALHQNELINKLQHILELHENRTDDTDILVANEITAILTDISTNTFEKEETLSTIRVKLSNIISYLDQHYTDDISLDSLADMFFISKYYLSREFKKEYGTTIIQYVLTKRITYAKELLRYSEASIEDIAHQCGIDDASYFNKIFKKIEGCTASEYRKRW